ncbi:MAG: sulfotransferase family 2 domain-containing protein [Pseudomonadota bacterium]
MPLHRINGRVILFIHVPKAGGTSVEKALEQQGGVALYDPGYLFLNRPWSRCSPQHMHLALLRRAIRPGFCDAEFAIVREPMERFLSEYRFRRFMRTLPKADKFNLDPGEPADLNPWAEWVLETYSQNPFILDNHIRPQSAFVGEGVKVFRLEDGLGRVFDWLSRTTGMMLTPSSTRYNETGKRPLALDPGLRRKVLAFYAADYEAFGYEERRSSRVSE